MAMLRRSARLMLDAGFSRSELDQAIALSLKDARHHSPGNNVDDQHHQQQQQKKQEGQDSRKSKPNVRRRKRGHSLQEEVKSSIGEPEAQETERKDEDIQSDFEEPKKDKTTEDAEDDHKKQKSQVNSDRSRTPASSKRKRRKKDAVRSHFNYVEPADKEEPLSKEICTVDDSDDDGLRLVRVHGDFAYPSRSDQDAVTFSRSDIECLEGTEYINGTVIALYIKHIQSTMPAPQNQIHVFNSFFYNKLVSIACDESLEQLQKLRKWIQGVDIFEKTYLLIPIHDRLHWSLAMICFSEPKPGCYILHLDSMKTGHDSSIVYEVLRRYLAAEWTSRGGAKVDIKKSHHVRKVKVPQQKNEYDCGLFMLHFIQKILSNAPPVFSEDMPNKMSDWFSLDEASELRANFRNVLQGVLKEQSAPENENKQAEAGEAREDAQPQTEQAGGDQQVSEQAGVDHHQAEQTGGDRHQAEQAGADHQQGEQAGDDQQNTSEQAGAGDDQQNVGADQQTSERAGAGDDQQNAGAHQQTSEQAEADENNGKQAGDDGREEHEAPGS